MGRFLPQNWNDTIALILILIIPTIWVLCGGGIIQIEDAVSGALIVTWTMVVQYYFRKAPTK